MERDELLAWRRESGHSRCDGLRLRQTWNRDHNRDQGERGLGPPGSPPEALTELPEGARIRATHFLKIRHAAAGAQLSQVIEAVKILRLDNLSALLRSMSIPKQHHYLPRGPYLNFFEVPDNPGQVYLYQRSKDTVLVSTQNAAKQKHLYSFVDKDGNVNASIEAELARIESSTKPILDRLNKADATFEITAKEKGMLFTFLSLLAVRTPAFRQLLQELIARFSQMMLQAYAQRRGTLKNLVEKAKKKEPDQSFDDVSIEELQEFILDESRYDIQASGDYFLGRQLEAQKAVFDVMWTKAVVVLRVEGENFITCDHPVSHVSEPGVPKIFGGGLLHSDIFVPIGRQACLLLTYDEHWDRIRKHDQPVQVAVRTISPQQAREINKLTIGSAEHFLFACEDIPKIKQLFDQTTRPTRFQFSHPFGRQPPSHQSAGRK